MQDYKYLKGALTICPVELGMSEAGYKERFKSFLENSDPSYSENIKMDFLEAIKDTHWSWKAAAKEAHFYAYDDSDSEEQILRNIEWLFSDSLFK